MGEKKTKKTQTKKSSSQEVGNAKLVAILSYIFLIGVIWYFVDENVKGKKLPKIHVQSALTLAIASIILWIIGTVVAAIAVVPIIGWIIAILAGIPILLANLGILGLAIFGFVYAIQEKKKYPPLVGRFAKKFNI